MAYKVEIIPESQLKSATCRDKSFLSFINQTKRHVDCVWFNYQGQPKLYKTLRPQEKFDIDTYESHPWTFYDADTTERLVVHYLSQNSSLLMPVRWHWNLTPEDVAGSVCPRRVKVYIRIPIFTLKERAGQVVHTIFRGSPL